MVAILLGMTAFAASTSTSATSVQKTQENTEGIIVPNTVQQEWAQAEIGVIIHFDMPVFRPDYQWRQFGTHPSPSAFNPTKLNTDQWLAAAQKLGAKYAVLVAKHCSGFSLWPTEAHDYSIKHSPYKNGKGDIVGEFVASCKKYGLKPGIYASTTANGYLWVDNPGYVQPGSPVTQQEYNHIVTQQLTELWSNYGPLFEIWFDGGVLSKENGGADILSLVEKLQPQAIAFQGPMGHPNLVRWVGNEEGTAPDPCWATANATTQADGTQKVSGMHGDPHAEFWCPGEADFTLRKNGSFQGGWFWHEGQDNEIFPLNQLMQKYETSVGRNTNMLLGLVVDNQGLVPQADVERLEAYGREIDRQYGHPDKQVQGESNELALELDTPTVVDRIILQEDISQGERVLEYQVKGFGNGQWHTLTQGTNIGHKRIARFAPLRLEKLKLEVLRSKSTPHIATFAAFHAL